jgi:hypothetical protein
MGKFLSKLSTSRILIVSKRVYVAFITRGKLDANRSHLTILDSALDVCTELDLENPLDLGVHVFTKAQGLIEGGLNGDVRVTKFNEEWTPTVSFKTEGAFSRPVTALTTNERCIAAGSEAGEVKLWDKYGLLLYKVTTPCGGRVYSISIEGCDISERDNFLVATPDHWYEYTQLHRDYTCFRQGTMKCRTWAYLDTDGSINLRGGKRKAFRPILPKSSLDRAFYIYTAENLDGPNEIGSQEFIISDLRNQLKVIRQFSVDRDKITHMWCNQERLFLIRQSVIGEQEILMMDFAKAIPDFHWNNSYKIAECFNLASVDVP